jgi:hypothetical protein
MEPWERLEDCDLICIRTPDNNETMYVSVMGNSDEYYAVAVYPGESAASTYTRMLESGATLNPLRAFGMQDCLQVHWGDRNDLPADERREIKELGLSFRGNNSWAHFVRMKPQCLPGHITKKDAELLLKVLPLAIDAYRQFLSQKLSFSGKFEEALLYEVTDGKVTICVDDEFYLPRVIREVIFDDAIDSETGKSFIAQMKEMPVDKKRIVEIDVLYLPMPNGKTSGGDDQCGRVLVAADGKSGIIIKNELLEADESLEDAFLNIMAALILDYRSRPYCIKAADEWMAGYIADICAKVGIKVDDSGVPHIDEFAADLMERM